MIDEDKIKSEICYIGKKLYYRNYIVGTDGNLSFRLPGDILLFTPSGICKGEMESKDIIKTDMNGNKISGRGKPSSEIKLHLNIYRERADVRAVVHAHPPIVVAFTLANGFNEQSLNEIFLPETLFSVGKIKTAPYKPPGTQEVADSILPFLSDSDAIILSRHGVVTVGKSLEEAYHKMETVEYTYKTIFIANQLGGAVPLDLLESNKLYKLKNLRKI